MIDVLMLVLDILGSDYVKENHPIAFVGAL